MPASKPAILSRRNVIAGCVAGVAAVGAFAAPAFRPGSRTGGSARSWWGSPSVANLARGNLRDWSRQVGSDFTLVGETGTVTVQLAEVMPMASTGRKLARISRQQAFALHFVARGTPLPAGDRIYAIRSSSQRSIGVYFSPTADTMIAIFG